MHVLLVEHDDEHSSVCEILLPLQVGPARQVGLTRIVLDTMMVAI